MSCWSAQVRRQTRDLEGLREFFGGGGVRMAGTVHIYELLVCTGEETNQ
jgi:hypothetical protein